MERIAVLQWRYVQAAPQFRNRRLGLDKWKTSKRSHQIWLFLNGKIPFDLACKLNLGKAVFRKALKDQLITQEQFNSLGFGGKEKTEVVIPKAPDEKVLTALIQKMPEKEQKKEDKTRKPIVGDLFLHLTEHQRKAIEFAHQMHAKLEALKPQSVNGEIQVSALSDQEMRTMIERHLRKNAPIKVR